MGDVSNQGLQQGAFDLTQFYAVFFEEAGENLSNMESMLLEIDLGQPSDEELNAVFRVAHSIKGGAATFGFADVTNLTHELETLLDRVRRHELALTRVMVDVLLEAGDVLRAQLAHRQGAAAAAPDTADLIGRIQILASGAALAAAPVPVGRAPAAGPATAPAPLVPPSAAPGMRRLHVRVGPLADGAVADNLAELFRDIPGLGTLSPLDNGQADREGYRRFAVETGSPDSELIELFSFHVAREQVQIEALADPAAAPPAPPPPPAAAADDGGFGFFVDPATLPAAKPAAAAAPAPAPAWGCSPACSAPLSGAPASSPAAALTAAE